MRRPAPSSRARRSDQSRWRARILDCFVAFAMTIICHITTPMAEETMREGAQRSDERK